MYILFNVYFIQNVCFYFSWTTDQRLLFDIITIQIVHICCGFKKNAIEFPRWTFVKSLKKKEKKTKTPKKQILHCVSEKIAQVNIHGLGHTFYDIPDRGYYALAFVYPQLS